MIDKYYDFKALYSQKACLVEPVLFLPYIATFSAAYRRTALETVGLFDSQFIADEDVDLSWRVCLKGYQLSYVPQALVYHIYLNKVRVFLKKFFEYGYSETYLLYKYAGLIKKPLLSYSECFIFLFGQLKLIREFLITIFTNKKNIGRTSPVLDFIRNMAFFSGRLLGLIRLKLRITKITQQPYPDNKLIRGIVNGEIIITDTNKDFCYRLNKTATKIWLLLRQYKSISEITDIIADEYEVNKGELRDDINSLINEFASAGFALDNRKFN